MVGLSKDLSPGIGASFARSGGNDFANDRIGVQAARSRTAGAIGNDDHNPGFEFRDTNAVFTSAAIGYDDGRGFEPLHGKIDSLMVKDRHLA